MDRTGTDQSCYLLLCGGRGAPRTQLFTTEDQARAEFGRIRRAARVKTQWMELSLVAGGGRLQRLASYTLVASS